MQPNALLRDVFDIPEVVAASDFVLQLHTGVDHAEQTAAEYVATESLARAFDTALGFINAALAGGRAQGVFLHGSFGSGKSHFMAVLGPHAAGRGGGEGDPRAPAGGGQAFRRAREEPADRRLPPHRGPVAGGGAVLRVHPPDVRAAARPDSAAAAPQRSAARRRCWDAGGQRAGLLRPSQRRPVRRRVGRLRRGVDAGVLRPGGGGAAEQRRPHATGR